MKGKITSMICVIALAATTFVSCNSDSESVEQDQELAQMGEKLELLGFNIQDLHKTTFNGVEGYAVEGDIFLTKDEIIEMSPAISISDDVVETEHYRTHNVVNAAGGRTISVYMDVEFNSTMQAAFDEALARYNALGLTLKFQRASSEGADIDVLAERLAKYRGYTILGRSAGFPDANGDPASPIVLNSDVYNPRRGGIPADAVTVIAHEIGHAIGFRHTDYADRSFSCGGSYSNEGAADVGAVYVPGTPEGPEDKSYMLACSNGTDRPFTAGDQTALTTVY